MEDGDPQASADGQTAVPGELDQKQVLHFSKLRRHLVGQIVRLRPVFVEVVQLPFVLIWSPFEHFLRQTGNPRRARPKRGRYPTVMVDGAAAHNLEVLRLVARLGFCIAKGLAEADTIDRILRNAVDHARWSDAQDIVNRWNR